jgi:NitT/TauT family transport system substrate-binding protein
MPKGRTFARIGFVLGLAATIAAWKLPPARAETITVTHWGGQFYGMPYAVAMEKGFFKKNGVDVTGILTAAGGGTAVRNTLAGGIPFGEVSLAAAVLAINSGQKLIIIGAGTQSVADQMWVVKGFNPHQHQRSHRQTNCLYGTRLRKQYADPDGAEGQRHHPAAGEARAGR